MRDTESGRRGPAWDWFTLPRSGSFMGARLAMARILVGLVSVILMGVFLGSLVIAIKSIPFGIIATAGLGIIIYDFVESVRKGNGNAGK